MKIAIFATVISTSHPAFLNPLCILAVRQVVCVFWNWGVGPYEHVVILFWRLDIKRNSLLSVMILKTVQVPISLWLLLKSMVPVRKWLIAKGSFQDSFFHSGLYGRNLLSYSCQHLSWLISVFRSYILKAQVVSFSSHSRSILKWLLFGSSVNITRPR